MNCTDNRDNKGRALTTGTTKEGRGQQSKGMDNRDNTQRTVTTKKGH